MDSDVFDHGTDPSCPAISGRPPARLGLGLGGKSEPGEGSGAGAGTGAGAGVGAGTGPVEAGAVCYNNPLHEQGSQASRLHGVLDGVHTCRSEVGSAAGSGRRSQLQLQTSGASIVWPVITGHFESVSRTTPDLRVSSIAAGSRGSAEAAASLPGGRSAAAHTPPPRSKPLRFERQSVTRQATAWEEPDDRPSWDGCDVCFEADVSMLGVQPCGHRLCAGKRRTVPKPVPEDPDNDILDRDDLLVQVGPGPRPIELCRREGRPAMPKPGQLGINWVEIAEKALLRKRRRNSAVKLRAPASSRGSVQVGARAGSYRPTYKPTPGRWKSIDAGVDTSDDQQDIARGRGMVEDLFQGGQGMSGTANAIMSSSDYISSARATFNNVEDGFYISPSFLDKITIHIAKNFMDLPKIKVPLILGIWGGKGQGKTFQCSLAYKKLGIQPIIMSAGELESGNAGEPAKLIRQRYREASDVIKKGKMCSLFINDLDAGAGRMGDSTQYTVNNQMVNATLMNIADSPTNVQLPGVYKLEEIPRVPIVCTGNDFSTLYAPLIRDGRMEKFYWNPTREDRIGVCMGIFQEDDVDKRDVEKLVDAFPGQSIDFFGALRARVYDEKVRDFVTQLGVENLGKRLINSREGKVTFERPRMTLDVLMKFGQSLVQEQENVKRVQLADAYMSGAELAGVGGSSLPEDYDGIAVGLKPAKRKLMA
ncbi:hypothetical protein QJQ45_001397 [Haematococcus lacustris]|nr:hypothetical protein QJQ45_001397 [Haematococcus lacustris]